MLTACIDRMSTDNCGDCERRDACAQLFSGLFGPGATPPRWASRTEARPRPSGRNIFFAILGELARNVERNVRERQQAMAREDPPKRNVPPAARTPGPFEL